MIFLTIQFYFRDIFVSVFQARDDFCIKVKTRWWLIFKQNHASWNSCTDWNNFSLRETPGRVAGQLSDSLKNFAGQKNKLPDRKKRDILTFKNLVHCYWYKLHVEVCYIHCLHSICSRFLGCKDIKKREKQETCFKTSNWWYCKNPTFAWRRL